MKESIPRGVKKRKKKKNTGNSKQIRDIILRFVK